MRLLLRISLWLRHSLLSIVLVFACAVHATPDTRREQAEKNRALLLAGELVALDQELNTAQRAYENGKLSEGDLHSMFATLMMPDPELEQSVAAWVNAAPASYAAQLVAAHYYFEIGTAWRGTRFISRTHPERLKRMQHYHERAAQHFHAALELSTKPVEATVGLINLARYQGHREDAEHWLRQGLALDPKSYLLHMRYIQLLTPRWGGSYESMQSFIAASRAALSQDQVKHLASVIPDDKARTMWGQKDYLATLNLLNEALSLSQSAYLYEHRSQINHILGRLDDALMDSTMALKLDSDSADVLFQHSRLLLEKHQAEEGIEALEAAAARWNTDAMFLLGSIYVNGSHGVSIQLAKGLALIEKSAHYWDDEQLLWLGTTYYKGLGVPQDLNKAFDYFRLSEMQANIAAKNELGLMYWYGQGTEPDHKKAAALWLEVARNGEWQGKHNLRYFLSSGERLSLLFLYPKDYAALIDEQMIYRALGGLAVLMLLAGWLAYRLNRAKPKQQEIHGGYHGIPMPQAKHRQKL